MNRYYDDTIINLGVSLKLDLMAKWIETDWLPKRAESDLLTLWVVDSVVHDTVMRRFNFDFALPDDYRFTGATPVDCPILVRVSEHLHSGDLAYRSGAFVYRFTQGENSIEVLVMAARYTDDGRMVSLACMPRSAIPLWTAFTTECERLLRAMNPEPKVMIIGGRTASFVPTTRWDEVILPQRLKNDILHDVETFFTKGIDVYKRLNLKPFRKLLLAGVPGTGKTMLCSALANWALERGYLVIYISSADQMGATFGKIQQALHVASYSQYPTLILLEELDAFLHDREKALVLNVLDGSESSVNDRGTLLIATTNYPEAIDERVLKRPGRLDRIFIIPETRRREDAEKMLRQFLGSMWSDEHRAFVPRLVGFPGAFIREVAIFALTQVAYEDLTTLPLPVLEKSFDSLKEQIDVRDDFLTKRGNLSFFGAPNGSNGNGDGEVEYE
jgi:hypothetical protein